MKKMIFTAVLLASASLANAQNVEVYGKMRVYQESYQLGSTSSVTQMTSDYSRFGIRGSEDLGQGLKARFTVETGLAMDSPSATTLGDRQSTVGLANQFGSVDLGRSKHALGRAIDNFDTFGNALFSSTLSVHASQGSRFSNAAFVSVKPTKNVTVNYDHGNSETPGVGAYQAAGVDLTVGNLAATVTVFDNNQNSRSTLVGARYNLQSTGTTFYSMYSKDEVIGKESTGASAGLAQKVAGTNLTGLVGYGKKNDKSISNEDVTAYNVGLNYNLSKRTILLARYVREDNTNNTKDLRRVAVGMEHNF